MEVTASVVCLRDLCFKRRRQVVENLGGFTVLHLQYNISAFSKTVKVYI